MSSSKQIATMLADAVLSEQHRFSAGRINELGGSIPAKAERTPAAFDAYVKAEIARWAPILKTAAAPEPAKSP